MDFKSYVMIEYTITHTFDQFRSNFYMQYVFGKVLKCRKRNFCPFSKIMKNDLFTDQKLNMLFWHFCHFHTFASIELNFHYFRKRTKMLFPTFQDLSIDILHVKIRPFLRILKKCSLLLKKVRFPSFFTLVIEIIWYLTYSDSDSSFS